MTFHVKIWNDPPSIENLKSLPWKEACLLWHKTAFDVFREFTPEEVHTLRAGHDYLRVCKPKGTPDVLLLAEGEGFMGENVYFVDNKVTSTLQRMHTVCNRDHILMHQNGEFWCALCGRAVPNDELG